MNTNDSFNQTKTVTARIVSVHKNRFQIALDSAERKAAEHDAVLAGRLLYRGEIPVVGDYIEAEFETSPVGKPVGDARIVSILPRKSLITRPEYRVGTQNMAANVDCCFGKCGFQRQPHCTLRFRCSSGRVKARGCAHKGGSMFRPE